MRGAIEKQRLVPLADPNADPRLRFVESTVLIHSAEVKSHPGAQPPRAEGRYTGLAGGYCPNHQEPVGLIASTANQSQPAFQKAHKNITMDKERYLKQQ